MAEPGRITLRAATSDDAALLLEWANDPATRAASFDRDPIAWNAHVEWLAGVLEDPDRRLWIAEEAGVAVGQVRIDRSPDGVGVVSIGLADGARGRGLGSAVLRNGLSAAAGTLGISRARAVVRASNVASRRLFEGAGFRAVAGEPPADSPETLVLETEIAAVEVDADRRP